MDTQAMAMDGRGAVLDAIRTRRAVRAFTPEPVGEGLVRTLMESAVCAPTAMHEEPWAFVVVQDRKLLNDISDRAREMWPAPVDARYATLPSSQHFAVAMRDPKFNIFYNAGTLIVVCKKVDGTFVNADCWLAAENLMLTAGELGLGTCCIGSSVDALNSAEIRRELGIPENVTAVAPIIVGYASTEPPDTGRRPPHVVVWK